MVGSYCCWSYPEEKLVHILSMSELNAVVSAKKKARKNAIGATLDVMNKASDLTLGMMGKMGSNVGNMMKSGVNTVASPLAPRSVSLINSGENDDDYQRADGGIDSPPVYSPPATG